MFQKDLNGKDNIPFSIKQDFDRYEKTIRNYFIDMSEEIIDGELHCFDMYYYSID